MMRLETKKAALAAITRKLRGIGFKRGCHGVWTIDISPAVLGTIGLNVATRAEQCVVEVNPVAGVRDQQLERIIADLSDQPFNQTSPPTLAANIGYLSPSRRYLPFLFDKGSPNESIAETLVDAIRAYGLPFMKTGADREKLVHELQTAPFSIPYLADFRIPVGLVMLGKRDSAENFLETKLSELKHRSDAAAVKYRAFAIKLLQRCRDPDVI